jgi:hypothetical protein
MPEPVTASPTPEATFAPTPTPILEVAQPDPTAAVVETPTPAPEATGITPEPTPEPTPVRAPSPVRFSEPFDGFAPRSVSLYPGSDDVTIRYTLDGSDPAVETGFVYEGPFDIFGSTIVSAIAFRADGNASTVTTATYTLEKAPLDRLALDLPGGVYIGTQTVEVVSNEPGVTIYYTLDGTTPAPATGLVYEGPVSITASSTVKAMATRPGSLDTQVEEASYTIFGNRVDSEEPIILSGDDVLEIVDTQYIHRGDIRLSGNAQLVIKDSIFTHAKEFAFEYGLFATENAQVVVENSGIGTDCTGSFNWSFLDDASFTASGVDSSTAGCNTWNFFSGTPVANIEEWYGFGGTICGGSDVTISNSTRMEVELCYPAAATLDMELPLEVSSFALSEADDPTITSNLSITDSTLEGWGINVLPGADITIRNSPAITIGVIVGRPWVEQTVELDGIGMGLYDDQVWDIADARLRLVNTTTYGWEPNAFADNTLIIRNSDYSGSAVNGGSAIYIIEDSTAGQLRAHEDVVMTVRNSIIEGDVIAVDNATITLIDSRITGNGHEDGIAGSAIATGNGRIVLINTTVNGEIVTEDNGEVVQE